MSALYSMYCIALYNTMAFLKLIHSYFKELMDIFWGRLESF
jgi:hypothetical protein